MNVIDIHTHGIGGFDTRTSHPEDILRMAEIQASLGVTAIIPAIYPDTIEIMRENMTAVNQKMQQAAPAFKAGVNTLISWVSILKVHFLILPNAAH